ELLQRDIRLISLGGDHAMTYPIIKSYQKKWGQLEIVHLDAHPDLYDSYDGNRLSHACPFARIMEEKLASHLVQIGIRTLNPHQEQQAERFGVEIITVPQLENAARIELVGPLYLSIDLDVLDPAFAPGVAHREPGGLTTRQVIELIQQLKAPIAGADIVEFNPARDPSEMTAMVAFKLLKEVAARMLERPLDFS
ncbi:MAG: arginase family protein, partial [Desulfobacterales bacterium]